MSVSVSMPQLGESVTEGTVTRWLKKEGERVEADEPLLEVSTDKVDTEIPSPVAGILRGITVAEDETVAVGAELAVIDENGAQAPAEGDAGAGPEAQAEPAAPAAAAESPADDGYSSGDQEPAVQPAADQPAAEAGYPYPAAGGYQGGEQQTAVYQQPAAYEAVGYGSPGAADPESVEEPPAAPAPDQGQPAGAPPEQAAAAAAPVSDIWRRSEPVPAPPAQAPAPPAPAPVQQAPAPQAPPQPGAPADDSPARSASPLGTADGPYVTPLVRKLAAEHGVDLATVTGTGVGGRIRKQDVVDAARVRREAIAAAQQSAAADGQAAGGQAPGRPAGPGQPVPARDRAVAPARPDRADVPGPAADRPPDGRVAADVRPADHGGRG